MRRQGAATPGATHRVSVGVAPSIRLPRQPRTAPLRRLPPHRSPWRRQFGARHPGSTAENAAAGRGNPGVHSPGVCGMCPQPPLAAAAHTAPLRRLPPAPLRLKNNNTVMPKFVQTGHEPHHKKQNLSDSTNPLKCRSELQSRTSTWRLRGSDVASTSKLGTVS